MLISTKQFVIDDAFTVDARRFAFLDPNISACMATRDVNLLMFRF